MALTRGDDAAVRTDAAEVARALAAFADQKQRMDGLFAAAPDLLCALRGPDHVIELVSGSWMAFVPGRELVGRTLREALPEVASDELVCALGDARRGSAGFRYAEMPVWTIPPAPGPAERYLDVVGRAIRARDGTLDVVLLFAHDITELVNARKAAEHASRAKDEFLAMLGHELRNPLAPIRTAIELLHERKDIAERLELRVIERQVMHLVGLVDDLLDLSRITRGKVELRRETVDLAEVIHAAVEMAAPVLEKREHRTTVDVPGRRLWVDGDRARLVQVFANILTNAGKYSEPRCEVSVRGTIEGGRAVVRVQDEGAGIAPDLLPRIFELFEQGRQTLDRAQGGLGLGLAIARTMVRMHGGEITAKSEGAGKGSEFEVQLPLSDEPTERVTLSMLERLMPEMARAEEPVAASPPLRVLVVDDNEDAAEMLSFALSTSGHETAVAHDGQTALETAGWFNPDVAVLDLGLPGIDGFELARRLREIPALAGVRLVAVTGYGQDSDRARARAAGFDAHLLKPIELADLHAMLEGRSPARPR